MMDARLDGRTIFNDKIQKGAEDKIAILTKQLDEPLQFRLVYLRQAQCIGRSAGVYIL